MSDHRKESSRSVFINGQRLSDEQLRSIEQTYRVKVPDGRYWYDRVCGAWGMEGGPQAGIAVAGLDLGGRLRADVSGGNTGVFVNGRELHLLDVQRLAAMVGNVIPGRWWVGAHGNFGPEGWPMIGNLFQIAQAYLGGAGAAPGGVAIAIVPSARSERPWNEVRSEPPWDPRGLQTLDTRME